MKDELFKAVEKYVAAKIYQDTAPFGISSESTRYHDLEFAERDLKKVLDRIALRSPR